MMRFAFCVYGARRGGDGDVSGGGGGGGSSFRWSKCDDGCSCAGGYACVNNTCARVSHRLGTFCSGREEGPGSSGYGERDQEENSVDMTTHSAKSVDFVVAVVGTVEKLIYFVR